MNGYKWSRNELQVRWAQQEQDQMTGVEARGLAVLSNRGSREAFIRHEARSGAL
jgi:hypothetical protein